MSSPRQELGSLAGMRILLEITRLMRQQTEILMLSGQSELLWERIADAPLVIDGREITLDRGKADFEVVRYGQKISLRILLFPKDTFTRHKREFALVKTDILFSVGSTYSRTYLCELKNGRLDIVRESRSRF